MLKLTWCTSPVHCSASSRVSRLTQQVDIYKRMKVDILRDVDPHQGA